MLKNTREGLGDQMKYSSLPEGFYSDSSSSSDDEIDNTVETEKEEVRRSMIRYGVDPRMKTIRVSYYLKIFAFIAALIVIPGELILRNTLMDAERGFIKGFQDNLASGAVQFIAKWITQLGEVMFVEGWAVFLYLFSDSLLGFKTSMVTFFGVTMIAIVKLLYQIQRPFWIYSEIEGKQWNFDFSGPSDHAFLATFFYSYVILIYSKYTDRYVNRIRAGLLLFNALVVALVMLSMSYLGNTFLFQGIVGATYGAVYCIACVSLDKEIHSLWERTAFIIKSSRLNKFKLFFISLFVFILCVLYFNAALVTFKVDHDWTINISRWCEETSKFESRIGIDYTFQDISVVFAIIGATFGASQATMKMSNILWSETPFWKRLARGIIGFAVIVGVFYIPAYIPYQDFTTEFFFHDLLTRLFASYLAYGVVPIVWSYIRLTNTEGGNFSSDASEASFRRTIHEGSHSSDDNSNEEESKGGSSALIREIKQRQ